MHLRLVFCMTHVQSFGFMHERQLALGAVGGGVEGASGALAAPDPFSDGEIFTSNDASFSLGLICNRCMAQPVRDHSMQRCNSCITALLHMGFYVISTED